MAPEDSAEARFLSEEAISAALLDIHAAIAARTTSPMEALLAGEFGRRHGWQVSDMPFSIRQLRLGVDSGENYPDEFMAPFGDHADFFRTKDGCPVAVAAHLYSPELEKILAWAAVNLLQVSFPRFPSWYNPCETCLALYFSILGMMSRWHSS